MKLDGHITDISDHGDSLLIVGQAFGRTESEAFRPFRRFELKVPNTHTNRRTFYIGREVTIELKAGKP